MKAKIAAVLCAALLVGSLSLAAPATVTDAQKALYTRPNGSTLTIQYPHVTVAGNAAASQKIAQYFAAEAVKAQEFFNKENVQGMKITEEKSYVVTLNDGKYLSFIDQGSIYFDDKAAHPTNWKNGVTFDLETGEQLQWQDIIRPEDAKDFTLEKINSKIFMSKYTLSAYFNGLTELPKNYYLDQNKVIHFLFGQYEIAPYATGIVDISMGKQAK